MDAVELSGGYVFFRESAGRNAVSTPVSQEESSKKEQPDEILFCKSCLNPVTRKDQAISINGSHTHTFFNPEGIVFELGCFSDASGCLAMGESTSEFTWFAGSSWRFALCRTCGIHLGWYYAMRDFGFYGLILACLRE